MKIESLGTQSRIFKWNHLWLMLILQFDGKCCSLLQCKINVSNAITNITKLLQTHHLPRRSVLFVCIAIFLIFVNCQSCRSTCDFPELARKQWTHLAMLQVRMYLYLIYTHSVFSWFPMHHLYGLELWFLNFYLTLL